MLDIFRSKLLFEQKIATIIQPPKLTTHADSYYAKKLFFILFNVTSDWVHGVIQTFALRFTLSPSSSSTFLEFFAFQSSYGSLKFEPQDYVHTTSKDEIRNVATTDGVNDGWHNILLKTLKEHSRLGLVFLPPSPLHHHTSYSSPLFSPTV